MWSKKILADYKCLQPATRQRYWWRQCGPLNRFHCTNN